MVAATFLVWQLFKRDEFFPNLDLSVPASAIVSHQTYWWYLGAQKHRIALQVPASNWPALLAQFRVKSDFRDVTPTLKSYGAFVEGRQPFLPARVLDGSAGEFLAHGRDGLPYSCHFLREGTTGQIWFIGRVLDD